MIRKRTAESVFHFSISNLNDYDGHITLHMVRLPPNSGNVAT